MLGASFVEYIHDIMLQELWSTAESIGALGVKNLGLLESAVSRPFQSAFGQDIYPTIIDKAAALFHSLISNHPFHDGNKRTAVVAVEHFLIANGFLPSLSNLEFYELAKSTASYRERGEPHDKVLDEIRKRLTVGTASLAQVRKEFTNVRREIEKKRKERGNFRRRLARENAASSLYRQQARPTLKAELAKIEKELKKLELLCPASFVELYAFATGMRRHIRRSPKNRLVLPMQ